MGNPRIDGIMFDLRKSIGKQIDSVSCGQVMRQNDSGEMIIGGDQEFISLHFSDGTSLRIESRSGWKDEGGFLIVRAPGDPKS